MHRLDVTATLLLAAGTALATNVDGFGVLVPALLAEPATTVRARTITGCALGNAAVLAAAWTTGQLLGAVHPGWMRWLGVVPITVGIAKLARSRAGAAQGQPVGGLLTALGMMCALGSDNVAVLGPLLWSLPPGQRWLVVAVHLALVPGVLAALYRCRVSRLTGRPLGQRFSGAVAIAVGFLVLAR